MFLLQCNTKVKLLGNWGMRFSGLTGADPTFASAKVKNALAGLVYLNTLMPSAAEAEGCESVIM